jgi:hypothetical protein
MPNASSVRGTAEEPPARFRHYESAPATVSRSDCTGNLACYNARRSSHNVLSENYLDYRIACTTGSLGLWPIAAESSKYHYADG